MAKKAKTNPVDYRAVMGRLMTQTVEDEARYGRWNYVAVRPQEVIATYTSGQTVNSDCSDGVRIIARLAGVPDDPAGNDYADFGNSSSIWTHLPHAPLDEVEVGDIFTFGFSTGEAHACMVYNVTNKTDPTVWNMGTQGQPVFRLLSQEAAGHPGMTVTLCKINLPPVPVPPAVAHLRAQTGFYSWCAWRLGEQGWKSYGAANGKVRPAVPKLIPPAWWTRYAKFLAARKKPNPATSKP